MIANSLKESGIKHFHLSISLEAIKSYFILGVSNLTCLEGFSAREIMEIIKIAG